jgi:hypothetical protein
MIDLTNIINAYVPTLSNVADVILAEWRRTQALRIAQATTADIMSYSKENYTEEDVMRMAKYYETYIKDGS